MMHVTRAKPQTAMSASIIHKSRPDSVAAGPRAPSEPAVNQVASSWWLAASVFKCPTDAARASLRIPAERSRRRCQREDPTEVFQNAPCSAATTALPPQLPPAPSSQCWQAPMQCRGSRRLQRKQARQYYLLAQLFGIFGYGPLRSARNDAAHGRC